MIDLYTWPTPNGAKVQIMLEETGLEYTVHPVNIGAGEQFAPDYLKINPNNKVPTIVDYDGPEGSSISVMQSGAILIYLAEKTGRFMPKNAPGRTQVIQWLMFDMGDLAPMLGQAHHFRQYAPEPIQYAIDRYTNEAARLYGVLDRRLAESEYVAGEYSIADISMWPWIRLHDNQGQDFANFPNIERWFSAIASRPAVQAGMEVLAESKTDIANDPKAREALFGNAQHQQGA